MRQRHVALVLAVAALFVTAGCLGGGGGDPTPTATPEPTTTDVPTTTTTPEPTATPTTTTATTTVEPEANIRANIYRLEPEPVHDGTTTFTLDLTNTGSTGQFVYNVTVVRSEGGDFDRSATGQLEVGANQVVSRQVTVDFRATGTYTVLLNGQAEATVDVRGLRVGGGGGGGGETTTTTTTEPAPPTIDVSVSGSSVVG